VTEGSIEAYIKNLPTLAPEKKKQSRQVEIHGAVAAQVCLKKQQN